MRFLLTSTAVDVATPADLPDDLAWVPAVVPGGVHESLVAAGELPHPYQDENEELTRWVEDRVWWYRTSFTSDPGRHTLVLPSVDTVAQVFLDGTPVGSHANAFRPFEVDLDLGGTHELVVRIQPPLHGLTPPECSVRQRERYRTYMTEKMEGGEERAQEANGLATADLSLTLRRKPTFSWGWDFAPKIASVGLLEQPVVRPVKDLRITGHHVRAVRVDVEARTAVVAVDVEATGGSQVRVSLTSPTGQVTRAVLAVLPGTRRTGGVVTVADAELWWTHDLGAPALYDLVVELLAGDEVLDRVEDRIGLRTIELDQSADGDGRLFRFVLNGIPTFSRGANWVPASMLRGSVTPEQVRGLVELSAAGEMTMLRVWGGGAYEQDAFYDACDELGVLVWQDFMFACTDYPSRDLGLQAEVLAEAEYQLTRLRNHPSLALWCGNNEIQMIHFITQGTLDPSEEWGWELFHALLPDAVQRWSPGAIYWPSSPWAEGGTATANQTVEGDRHAWEVWHGLDLGAGGPTEFASRGEQVHFHRYGYDHGRFVSEFGIHACPQLDTLARWTSSPLELGSAALLHRIKDTPKDKGWDLLGRETGHPRDLAEYVDFSMATQAEGLKYGVEHYRRRQPHCGGTLVWQLNDSWPGLSWSVIDSALVPKAGYWFLQRAYAPVLASFRTTDDGALELWVTNSGRTAVPLELTVEVGTFDGALALREEVAHLSAPGSSAAVWSATGVVAPDRLAWVSEASARVPANRSFFAPLKELTLGGTVTADIEPSAAGARVHLVSSGYSYLTRVTSSPPGLRCSTNYLDLRDGERAVVEVVGAVDDLLVSTWGSRDQMSLSESLRRPSTRG